MTRKIAWFASFSIAVMVVLLMRISDFDWLTTFVTAALTFVVLPDILLRQHCAVAGASNHNRSRTTGM